MCSPQFSLLKQTPGWLKKLFGDKNLLLVANWVTGFAEAGDLNSPCFFYISIRAENCPFPTIQTKPQKFPNIFF